MKLVHLADLHIGFRQYDRLGPRGENQRELDVEQTFERVVDRVIVLAPDLIVIAGDVVHSPKPSTNAILALQLGFARLTAALPRTEVIISAGNHDLSKAAGDKCILRVLAGDRVHIAEREAVRFYFADRDLSVLAVPDAPGLVRPSLEPDPRAHLNVLCLHGEVQGVKQGGAEHRASTLEITREELDAAAWTYAAFGHYHQYEQARPNAAYAGSIDFTSSNIWGELATPKGFVERDLESGAQTFHEVTPARRVIDLPAIDVDGLGAADVDARIRAAVEGTPIDDVVARLRVRGITREVSRALDQKTLRSYKRRALNFQIAETRTARVRPESLAMLRGLSKQSVTDRIRQDLETREKLPNDIDREQLIARGLEYYATAAEKLPPTEVLTLEPASAGDQRMAS